MFVTLNPKPQTHLLVVYGLNPKPQTHLLVVFGLVSAADSLEDLGLELVVLLEVLEKLHGLAGGHTGLHVSNDQSFKESNFLPAVPAKCIFEALPPMQGATANMTGLSREKVEGVDDHDLDLAVLEVSEASAEVGDDAIAGNHGVGEDGVAVVLLDLGSWERVLVCQAGHKRKEEETTEWVEG